MKSWSFRVIHAGMNRTGAVSSEEGLEVAFPCRLQKTEYHDPQGYASFAVHGSLHLFNR